MNKNRKRRTRFARDALVVGLALLFLMPVIWVVLSSFKPDAELYLVPPTLLPREPTLANYQNALTVGHFATYTWNSFFVATMSTLIALLTNSMAAFALAKYRFVGRQALFLLTLATIMIPLQVIMVPIFLVLRNLGLTDSLWGIIIPPAATPTGVFLLRQYILSIPDEILESARIDGASEWGIYWRIILPLSVPALATLAIFSFTWRWNDFIWPFIVISSEQKATLQLALARLVGQFGVDWGTLLAATVITLLPMLIVFLLLQRYFLSDLTAGSVKG
ncbi:MAG: carbohydrate ABC transporter permease [Meiothermus sp.]|uniref:carbohydrate ABC transporter permease n=1 Tax=Meiothermus sp. TaxID=1955249 RepID=UPI0025F10BF6|nr:carbohydrate ABC transporter permease [Meiothermus sp.]MCS7058815.1 carbohydrate ABC transporter permease [Meiothermus sp.]MCS7194664.1 carbohydrate ABC transporter permease [Meiothermus sp.]